MAGNYNLISNLIIAQVSAFDQEIKKSGTSAWRSGNKILREQLQTVNEPPRPDRVIPNDANQGVIQDAAISSLNTFYGPTLQKRLDSIGENMVQIEETTRLFYEQNFGAIDLNTQAQAQASIREALQHWEVRTSPNTIHNEIIQPAVDWLQVNMGTAIGDEAGYTIGAALTEYEHRMRDRFSHYLTPRAQISMTLAFSKVNKLYAENYQIQWYRYIRQRGVPPERREFCEAHESGRFGNVEYYHIQEIQTLWPNWQGGDWEGSIPGTASNNITINRGGFGCLHVFEPLQRGQMVDARSRAAAINNNVNIPF